MRHTLNDHASIRNIMVFLLAISLAVLLGTVVSFEPSFLLIGILTFFGIVPLTYFVARRFSNRTDWLLTAVWMITLSANLVQVNTHLPIGYLQELLLFILSLSIVGSLWFQSQSDKWLRVLICIYAGYLVISIVSSLTGRSQLLPALWQLQYNLKWPLMFGLGCMVIWNTSATTQLIRIIKYSWIILLVFVVLEIVAPSIHSQLLGPPTDLHQNPLLGFGYRYSGPFKHSGYLAIACATLAVAALAHFLVSGGIAWVVSGVAYFALLVLSGQRQELLACIFALLIIGVICNWQFRYFLISGIFVLLCIAVVSLFYLEIVPMEATLTQWGMLDWTSALSERAILSLQGINVANQYWPLGSGLGTYGGPGAQKFDQSLYVDLGFQRYWWFRQSFFLVDTFWPGVIAESGFIGAAIFLLIFIVLWLGLAHRALVSHGTPLFATSLTALAALTIMLANTPSSGILTDPRGSFLFWLVIGAAWHASNKHINQKLLNKSNQDYGTESSK